MTLIDLIIHEIDSIALLPFSDVNTLDRMRFRTESGHLIREENPEDHFCVFVVPFHKESNQVFLGHHKKANDWIPPGGHIEKHETPRVTAVREAKEELGVSISEKQLQLFTLDYLDVSAPNKVCKVHWHIWYIFNTDIVNYEYDKREFYNAAWFTVEKALPIIRIPEYREVLTKLPLVF